MVKGIPPVSIFIFCVLNQIIEACGGRTCRFVGLSPKFSEVFSLIFPTDSGMIKTVNILIILLIYKQGSLPVQRICKEQTAVFHSGGQTTHNRKRLPGHGTGGTRKKGRKTMFLNKRKIVLVGIGDGRHELWPTQRSIRRSVMNWCWWTSTKSVRRERRWI